MKSTVHLIHFNGKGAIQYQYLAQNLQTFNITESEICNCVLYSTTTASSAALTPSFNGTSLDFSPR